MLDRAEVWLEQPGRCGARLWQFVHRNIKRRLAWEGEGHAMHISYNIHIILTCMIHTYLGTFFVLSCRSVFNMMGSRSRDLLFFSSGSESTQTNALHPAVLYFNHAILQAPFRRNGVRYQLLQPSMTYDSIYTVNTSKREKVKVRLRSYLSLLVLYIMFLY